MTEIERRIRSIRERCAELSRRGRACGKEEVSELFEMLSVVCQDVETLHAYLDSLCIENLESAYRNVMHEANSSAAMQWMGEDGLR